MTRLTTEAVDALLAEHRGITRETGLGTSTDCADLQCPEWPCTTWLLATEVRDARELAKVAKEMMDYLDQMDGNPRKPGCDCLYDALPSALAHYEEGRK